MTSQFDCPHCQQPIKAIGLKTMDSVVSTNQWGPLEIDDTPPSRLRPRRGFWPSMTGTYIASALLAGAVVWWYVWWAGYSPIWAVIVVLLALFGLPIFELVTQRPPQKKPKQTKHDIRVRMTSEDGHDIWLDRFYDKTIQPDKVGELAALVLANDLQWLGRPTVCKETNLTQTDYLKIAHEFEKQGYLINLDGRNRVLSFRGRAFTREMASHQQPPTLPPQTVV